MVGRLSKILNELNIGLQTARSILGRSMTLNTKISEVQFRVLVSHVRNLTVKHKASPTTHIAAPTEYSHGVPEEIYAKSNKGKKRKVKVKSKLGILAPKPSLSKKGSAKYSDAYSLQQLKNNLARKFDGYEYGLSDW